MTGALSDADHPALYLRGLGEPIIPKAQLTFAVLATSLAIIIDRATSSIQALPILLHLVNESVYLLIAF